MVVYRKRKQRRCGGLFVLQNIANLKLLTVIVLELISSYTKAKIMKLVKNGHFMTNKKNFCKFPFNELDYKKNYNKIDHFNQRKQSIFFSKLLTGCWVISES